MKTNREFIESMANFDEVTCCNDIEKCGCCYHHFLFAEVAREMLTAENFDDAINKWVDETTRRWQESKFYKLWSDAEAKEQDPRKVFERVGWTP